MVALVVVVTLEAAQETSFSCTGRSYGYYADVEAECEMFHICNNNVKWTFRCPNQTLFNQVRFLYLLDPHTCLSAFALTQS